MSSWWANVNPVSSKFCVFLVLSFKSSVSILDNSSLSGISFTSMFSQSVAYLFILSRRADIFNFNEAQLINSSLMDRAFQDLSKNVSSNPRPSSLSPSSERLLRPRNDSAVTVGHTSTAVPLKGSLCSDLGFHLRSEHLQLSTAILPFLCTFYLKIVSVQKDLIL